MDRMNKGAPRLILNQPKGWQCHLLSWGKMDKQRDLQKEAEGLYKDVFDFSKEVESYLEENNRYTTQHKGVNIRFFNTDLYVWASLEQKQQESGL